MTVDSDGPGFPPLDIYVSKNGTYRATGLEPGNYSVSFTDQSSDYQAQCYGGGLRPEEASCSSSSDVTVKAGEATTLKPVVLTLATGHVQGTVSDTKGRPIAGISVMAWEDGSAQTGDNWAGVTDAAGHYSIDGIVPGKVRIIGGDEDYRWTPVWFDKKDSFETAQVVTLATGENHAGVDFAVKSTSVATVKATAGTGTVSVAITVKKNSSGSPAGGSVSVSSGTKTVQGTLVSGKVTLTLTGLKQGSQDFTIAYSGSEHTSPVTKVVKATVK